MKNKFPGYSTMKQAYQIYRILNPAANDTDIIPQAYNISDIFNLLPNSIEFDGHRGDLCVSTVDIAYFSINGDWKHILVHHEPIPLDGDIYDAFYNMVVWLKENNLI